MGTPETCPKSSLEDTRLLKENGPTCLQKKPLTNVDLCQVMQAKCKIS